MSNERKPVWEEEWRCRNSPSCTDDVYCEDERDYIFRGSGLHARDEQRARLAAAAPDMARALLAIAEAIDWDSEIIDAALRKAGVR